MKKQIVSIAAMTVCAALATSCVSGINGRQMVKASNTMADTVYEADSFNAIDVSNQARVIITTGGNCSVTAHVPDNVKDYFIVRRNGNKLIVSNRGINLDYPDKERAPILYVTMPSIAAIDASGQSEITLQGDVAQRFETVASDQSRVIFRNALSAGHIALKATGQSEVEGKELTVTTAGVEAEDQGNIDMTTLRATGDVSVSTAGQSDIEFSGISSTAFVSFESDDQSRISVGKINAATGSANASGQSDIKVKNLTGRFTAKVRGQASCSFPPSNN